MVQTVYFAWCLLLMAVSAKWVKEMEIGGNFQGDINLDPDERAGGSLGYASIKGVRWPGGVVPYLLSRSFTPTERQTIMKSMATYHKHTCIKWIPRMIQREYVSIVKGNGCNTQVGFRKGRKNILSLGRGCVYPEIIIHEMGHTIGLYHEQARPDRDNYLTIMWQNIEPSHKHNFDKLSNSVVDSLGSPYDYLSIMHYGEKTFGDGKVTMKTKDPKMQHIIGQGTTFSQTDIKQIAKMYNCKQ